MKFLFSLFLIALPFFTQASSQDTGKITRVYVKADGSIALLMEGGFKNAIETNQCINNNGWAGNKNADSALKAAIISAKTAGQTITVTLEGCEGAWIKLVDLYIN